MFFFLTEKNKNGGQFWFKNCQDENFFRCVHKIQQGTQTVTYDCSMAKKKRRRKKRIKNAKKNMLRATSFQWKIWEQDLACFLESSSTNFQLWCWAKTIKTPERPTKEKNKENKFGRASMQVNVKQPQTSSQYPPKTDFYIFFVHTNFLSVKMFVSKLLLLLFFFSLSERWCLFSRWLNKLTIYQLRFAFAHSRTVTVPLLLQFHAVQKCAKINVATIVPMCPFWHVVG